MSEKKQLIDPIGTMCKLVSLIFCTKYTKISIQDHVLTLQAPSGYQFMLRMYNGDGRENISELYYVIIRLIKWYIVPKYELLGKTNILTPIKPTLISSMADISDAHNINKSTIDISNTTETDLALTSDQHINEQEEVLPVNLLTFDDNFYSNSNHDENSESNKIEMHTHDNNNNISSRSYEISNCDEFIKMLNYLCDAFTKLQETYEYGNVVLSLQFYINLIKDAINGEYNDNMLPKYILEKDKEYENLIDYDKLKNLWDVDKIKRICQLYDDCMVLKGDTKLSEKTRDSLIKGYLKSIYSILDDCDTEFKKLVQNSNKG